MSPGPSGSKAPTFPWIEETALGQGKEVLLLWGQPGCFLGLGQQGGSVITRPQPFTLRWEGCGLRTHRRGVLVSMAVGLLALGSAPELPGPLHQETEDGRCLGEEREQECLCLHPVSKQQLP